MKSVHGLMILAASLPGLPEAPGAKEQGDRAARQARELVEQLRSDSVEERERAGNELRKLGKAAVPELKKAARSKNAELASQARELLRVLDSAHKLLEELEADTLEVQWRAAKALRKLSPVDHIPDLIELLEKPGARWFAASVLSGFPMEGRSEDLIRLVLRRDSKTRSAATSVIVRAGMRETAPKFEELLESRDPKVRRFAVSVLGDLAVTETARKIRPLLADTDARVKMAAVVALARLGDADSSRSIIELLKDPNPRLRRHAALALGELESKEATGHLAGLLEDGDVEVRAAAAASLSLLGSRKGIPFLLRGGRKGPSLALLNAFRRPEVWQRLRGKTAPGIFEGTLKDNLNQLERASGLTFEYPPQEKEEGDDDVFIEVWSMGEVMSFGGAVRVTDLLARLEIVGEIVLEEDRVRFLSRPDAFTFWRTWWEGVQVEDR